MKKLKVILALVLCVLLISAFFVGCNAEDKFVEVDSSSNRINPFSSFSTIGDLTAIEIKGESVYMHYTYNFKTIKGEEETVKAVEEKITKYIDDANKKRMSTKSYEAGKKVVELRNSKIEVNSTKNENNETITKTQMQYVLYTKYLSNINSTYIKRTTLTEYLKNYDINTKTYLDANGNKTDLSKISKAENCYYMYVYITNNNYKDKVEISLNGKILAVEKDSGIEKAIKTSSATPKREKTEFVYIQTDNTLLWILLPITSVIVIALVVLIVIKFSKNNGKKGVK